ncbi:MAG: rod shape-determining protein MreC, partial [Candidatus Paceibacterota bacterium]
SLFLSLLLWGFLIIFFSSGLKYITTEVLAIAQPAQERTGYFVQWIGDLFNFANLRNEYYRLKEKEKNFNQNLGAVSVLKNENADLYKLLHSDTNKFNILPAKVLVGDINGSDGIFIINRGLNDNLKVGMNIIIPDNILVGRVIEVFKNYSKVESLHSINTNLSVLNLDKNFLALLKKDSSGSLTLKFYADDNQFNLQDILVTSSENQNYLSGLLVGKVKSITNTPLTSQKNVLVELFFEPSKLHNVFVITNYP